MDLIDGLKAFVVTAQSGSFTDAAERLGISNRLTSKYVAQLEEKIGARLLQRTTRKVGLTPLGQELLARAPALLDELDDLLGSVSEESLGLTGLLRISAPVTFGEMYISDLLSRFCSQHPHLSVDLRLNDSHIDLAADGFDLAFRVGEPEMNTLKARKLGEITSVLIASRTYLDTHGTPRTPADLAEHICIVDTNRRDANRWVFSKQGQEHIIHPTRHFMVNNARIARDWAINGHGVALVPSFIVQKYQQGELVQLLTDYRMQTHPVCAIYLNGNVIPKKVRTLIDFAVSEFSKNQLMLCP